MVDGHPPLGPGDVFAGYRIEALAGRGGFGLVYRARDDRAGRAVAIKILAPHLAAERHFLARFEREARLIAEIEHPHVIPIYTVGDDGDRAFIVMRFVAGMDLGHYLRDRGRFDPESAARLIAQVASALDAAHERGLVHRDVKPSNVLVHGTAPDEHLYLTDFGLTKRVDDTGPGLTARGAFVGTLDYVAPEQIYGDPVGARTDVYALGCVLYQLLTGTVPFPADDPAKKRRAHLSAPAPRAGDIVPGLPSALDKVIERALAKEPADRFASAGALARAAQAAAAGLTDSVLGRAGAPTADDRPVDAGEEQPSWPARRPANRRGVGGLSISAGRDVNIHDVRSGDVHVEGDWREA